MAQPLEVLGPAPWYLVGRRWEIDGQHYEWKQYGEKFGPTGLYREGEQLPRLLVSIYSCVVLLPSGAIVVWHPQRGETDARHADEAHTAFLCLTPATLAPFKPDRTGEELNEDRTRWHWESGEVPTPWLLSNRPSPGEYEIEIPAWLTGIEELLVLIDQPPKTSRAIVAIRPRTGRATYLPLTWFNSGEYDFGYQWVTRVAREASGDIVGDGIRIRPFRLDPTGATLKRWLVRSPLP